MGPDPSDSHGKVFVTDQLINADPEVIIEEGRAPGFKESAHSSKSVREDLNMSIRVASQMTK